MYSNRVVAMPKQTANVSAAIAKTNSRVGKTYPSKCKTGICYQEYVVDNVVKCAKCDKIQAL